MDNLATDDRFEDIINWTLPGLTLYYRDTDLPTAVTDKYFVGLIFRAATFVDVSGYAGRLIRSTRFLIASSKAAPMLHVRSECERWKMHVINCNSYFKVLDSYELRGFRQIMLLHIPAQGVDLFRRAKLELRGEDLEEQFISKGRASFDSKQRLDPAPAHQEAEWLDRTGFPIGLDARNEFFSELPSEELPAKLRALHSGIRKLVGDDTDLDVVRIASS